jgi:hypothetical protein
MESNETITHKHWCDCTCVHCEMGAHERCGHPQCHMPKWADVQDLIGRKAAN